SNAPSLAGTVLLEISRSGSTLTNDQIQLASGTLTYGGTLTVTNIGPESLAAGNRFPLFSASSYGGFFAITNLPPLAAGLAWTNKLLLDGSIEVVATVVSRPQFSTVNLSGTNLIFSGSNGVPNSSYTVLTSTNVA